MKLLDTLGALRGERDRSSLDGRVAAVVRHLLTALELDDAPRRLPPAAARALYASLSAPLAAIVSRSPPLTGALSQIAIAPDRKRQARALDLLRRAAGAPAAEDPAHPAASERPPRQPTYPHSETADRARLIFDLWSAETPTRYAAAAALAPLAVVHADARVALRKARYSRTVGPAACQALGPAASVHRAVRLALLRTAADPSRPDLHVPCLQALADACPPPTLWRHARDGDRAARRALLLALAPASPFRANPATLWDDPPATAVARASLHRIL